MSNTDTREIRRDQWIPFFDNLSTENAGSPVTMEAYGPGTNPHREVATLPLVGVTYESKSDSIEIILGTELDDHISHTVFKPTQVWLSREGAGDVLDIRSDDGLTLMLRLSNSG